MRSFYGNNVYLIVEEKEMNLDIIFKIAGVGIIVSVLNMILKKSEREEYGLIVTIAGLIVVLLVIINEIASLFDTVKSVFGF